MAEFEKHPPKTPFGWRRFECGKTQMQLQRETDVLQSRISAFENGLLRPRDWERKALAKALRIAPENLMFPRDYTDEPTK